MLQIPRVLRPFEIEGILQTLPKGLEETYDRLLLRVDHSVHREIPVALKWLALASRPLYIEEVIEASILDPRSAVSFNAERRMSATQLLSSLTGLVTVEPPLTSEISLHAETHILALSHSSIRAYLIPSQKSRLLMKLYQFDEKLAQDFIAESCVEYQIHCFLVSWTSQFYPLAKYTCRYWSNHAKHNQQLSASLRKRMNDNIYPLPYPSDGPGQKLLLWKSDCADGDFSCDLGVLIPPSIQASWSSSSADLRHHEIYTELDLNRSEFRLVIILPSISWDDPLECRLHVVSMDEVPFYIAISYAWGSDAGMGIVLLNGISMRIRQNMEVALRHLRQASNGIGLVFWVNALCINYYDGHEKYLQTAQKPSIFKNASKVIAWLGPEAGSSSDAIGFLSSLEDASESTESVANLILSMSIHTWHALQDLLQRQWFSMPWVIQDLVLAKKVEIMCGKDSCNWSAFERIEKAYASHGLDIHEYTSNFLEGEVSVDRMASGPIDTLYLPARIFSKSILGSHLLSTSLAIRRRYQDGHPYKLPEVLWMTRHRQCTEESDKILACLSVLGSKEYCKLQGRLNLPYFQDSCLMFAEYWLQESGELDLLSYVDPTSQLHDGDLHLPSWVPNWNCNLLEPLDPGETAQFFKEGSPRIYHAASSGYSLRPKFSKMSSYRILALSAVDVDVVQILGEAAVARNTGWVQTGDSDGSDTGDSEGLDSDLLLRSLYKPGLKRDVVLQWREMMKNPDVIRRYGHEALENVFWRTFLADQELSPFESQKRLGKMSPPFSKKGPRTDEELNQIFAAWSLADPSYLSARTFFTTRRGYVGLCPECTEPGDRIVLFLGGRMPYIIRLQPIEGVDHLFYRLIGEA